MTIVANTFAYVIGADTHSRTHTLAVLDARTGARVDTRTFPTTPAGCRGREVLLSRAPGLDRLGHRVAKDTVLSVGDIFLNDLSVPLERGAATALIDPFDRVAGEPDVRARSFEELIPFIRRWAALDAERSVTSL